MRQIKNKKYFETLNKIIDVAGGRNKLCEILGVKKTALSNWISKKSDRLPSFENASKIENIFGCDIKILRGK